MLNIRTALAGLASLAILATAGGLVATAAFDGEAVEVVSPHEESFPPPVIASSLFVRVAADGDQQNVCMSSAAVITRLKAEMATVGGRIFVLTDGLEQSFADRWRHEAKLSTVPVSAVVAHAFPSAAAEDILVDVVEFELSGLRHEPDGDFRGRLGAPAPYRDGRRGLTPAQLDRPESPH